MSSQKTIDYILKILIPSKLFFSVLSLANIFGYWYYEQFLWLKLFLMLIVVLALIWFIYGEIIQPLATLNVFLLLRNLYYVAFVETISFNLILIICFLLFLAIFYFIIEFEKTKGAISVAKNSLLYTMFGALSMLQFMYLMLYWQDVPEATMAILITLIYYIIMRTIEIEDDNSFAGAQLIRIFAISAIICILVITTLNWREF